MAPTNNLNGPAIAFLTLASVFLLLLVLIWYRYLIWWNVLGRRFYDEEIKRRESHGEASRSVGPTSGELGGSRGLRGSMLPWIPERGVQKHRAPQGSLPKWGARSTDKTRGGGRNYDEPRVADRGDEGRVYPREDSQRTNTEKLGNVTKDLEMGRHDEFLPDRRRQIFRERGRHEHQSLPPNKSDSKVIQSNLASRNEPLEGLPRTVGRGHRISSSNRPESESETGHGGQECTGERQEAGHQSTDRRDSEQENERKRDTSGSLKNDGGCGNRRGSGQSDNGRITRSPSEVMSQPSNFTQDDMDGSLDGEAQESHEPRQPLKSPLSDRHGKKLTGEFRRYRLHRHMSPETLQAEEVE